MEKETLSAISSPTHQQLKHCNSNNPHKSIPISTIQWNSNMTLFWWNPILVQGWQKCQDPLLCLSHRELQLRAIVRRNLLWGNLQLWSLHNLSPIKAGISLTFCFPWNKRQGLTKCAHKRVLKTGMKLYQRHSSCKCCKCKATSAQTEIESKVLVQIQIWQQSAAPLLPSSPPWTIDSSIVTGQCFCDVHQS